jgi:hypothetical protein
LGCLKHSNRKALVGSKFSRLPKKYGLIEKIAYIKNEDANFKNTKLFLKYVIICTICLG